MIKTICKRCSILFFTLIALFYIWGGGFGCLPKNNNSTNHIFSHRGYPLGTVENSTEAFKKSFNHGIKAIELDIRMTKDNVPVIFHDASCKRLLGLSGNITDYSWEEIKKENLLYNGEITTNTVIKLSDFLNNVALADVLYLDIKEASIELGDQLIDLLLKKNNYKTVMVADENLPFLIYLRSQTNKIPLILEGFNKGKEWIYFLIPKRFKPDYLASFLSEVDQNHISFLKENELLSRKIVYGVKSKNFEQAKAFGIQNMVVDINADILEKLQQ